MAKNFEHLIHKNSNVTTNGNPKLPTSGQIEYGEIAVNYATGKETISLKNSNNDIVTFSSDEQINALINKSEKVTAAALNDLNSKLATIEGADDEIREIIRDDEYVLSLAINELNGRITEMSADVERITEMSADVEEIELGTATALTNLDEKVSQITTAIEDIDLITSSALTKLDDEIAQVDSVTAGALNDLNARIISLDEQITTLGSDVDEIETVAATALDDLDERVNAIQGLPQVSASDNGKTLMVVDGAWALVNSTVVYSGSGTPSNSQGNNGDIYVQTS